MGSYGKKAYAFLEQLSFRRASGTPEEFRAAELIAGRIREIGFHPEFEPFTVSWDYPAEASLALTEPQQISFPVTGLINAGNTPEAGTTAEFYYLRNIDEISLKHAKDKFVLLNARPSETEYKLLVEAGIAGFLLMTGTSRDTRADSDLDTMRYRDCYGRYGVVPAFAIRMIDALELLHRKPERVWFRLRTEESTSVSRNIVVEVPGSDLSKEVLAVGAHYDSTKYSYGAWDNGAGVVQLLGLLEHLKANPPRRSIKAIFFGSEEVGLKGSRAYLEAHPDMHDSIQTMINLDVGGSYLGKEMVAVTGLQTVEAYVQALLYESGHSAHIFSGVMSSDSAVFSDYGIPSISLGQFPPQGGGYMHTRYDNIGMISEDVLAEEIRFLNYLVDRLSNAEVFPIPRVIPQDLRKKIIDYFGTGLSHTETVAVFPEEPKPSNPPF